MHKPVSRVSVEIDRLSQARQWGQVGRGEPCKGECRHGRENRETTHGRMVVKPAELHKDEVRDLAGVQTEPQRLYCF
jgi:hypothetical protein